MVLIYLETLTFLIDLSNAIPKSYPKRKEKILENCLKFEAKTQFSVSVKVKPMLEDPIRENQFEKKTEELKLKILEDWCKGKLTSVRICD